MEFATRNRELELRSMRYEALAQENDQLRGLQEALPPVAERWIVAEIVDIQLNSLRQRVLINRGTRNGLFKGQAVLDDKGLLGQTTHVGPFSAEVILITDPEHAVPVQIDRTGLRTIAVGTGDTASLALPYLPANADVKVGDVLTTSGLGGVFPAGYPVGRVVEVHRDAVQPLAQVRAEPFASMNIDREVMLVWFREGHPAAPVSVTAGGAKTGNTKMQPQPAPPRKAPPPATPTAAPTAPSPGDAATVPAPAAKPAAPKPAKPATPQPKDDVEEGPPSEEDIPPKPEPKPGTAQPTPPQPPKADAPQASNAPTRPRSAQATAPAPSARAPTATPTPRQR